MKKLQLGRKRKNGLVNTKAFDKLVAINNALNDESDKGNDELDAFIYDLQARIRRVTRSCIDGKLDYGIWNEGHVTKIYCLTASVAFGYLLEEHPRNLVLASGTLPNKKKSEEIFGISFNKCLKFYLENPYMLYLTLLGEVNLYQNRKGEKTYRLIFTKREQENEELLLNIKKTLMWYLHVVPGGILICFPNYPAIKFAYDLWGEKRLEEEKVYFYNRRLFREFPDKDL